LQLRIALKKLAIVFALLIPGIAAGQSLSLYNKPITNSAGRPVGGALVAVCQIGATVGTTTTPCSPLATIYSDSGGTMPIIQPGLTTDGLGNLIFWAPPGAYDIQIYGPSVNLTMYLDTLACLPGGVNCGGPGGGNVTPGNPGIIPIYNGVAIGSNIGPSNCSITGVGLGNLSCTGSATFGSPSLPAQLTGALQPSGCTAPGAGFITFFLGDSVTGLPLIGSGTNPCVPLLVGSPYVVNVPGGYPATAAGINSADTALGANAGVINVTTPGSYCDTQVLLSANHTLSFGPGLYQVNIAGADSTTANVAWAVVGAGSNQTTLQSCASSNSDAITSQHFPSLTGTSNFYGVYHPVIRGLTIDGNKANETAGFGIRLYGRAIWPIDVFVQNAFQDGYWLEWGGTESDTGSGTSVSGMGSTLESDYNGGNGFTFKGATGAIQSLASLIAHNDGGWGLQTFTNIQIGNINTYENTSGGCDVKSAASILASVANCETGTGWGLLIESGAGITTIASGILTGNIPFESDSSSGGTINASIANSGSSGTLPCIKFNGGGGYTITANFFTCNPLVSFVSELQPDIIMGVSTTAATLTSGTPSTADFISLVAGSTKYNQLPSPTITMGGNLLVSPIAPTISTHFNTSGDAIVANGTSSILVVTGTGAGTSTGVLAMPTAANGWNCSIGASGASAPQETSTGTASVTFTNYNFAGTPTNWANSTSLHITCQAY
jgi:hypothetical protein